MDDRLYRLPVIFVHFGKCDYLRYSVDKAAQTNPTSRIIVLTDEKQDLIERPNVEVHDLYDYFNGASDFAVYYKHLSTNDFHYELSCFQRWFVIKEFCEKEDIENFFYCDSDVFLFCNVSEEFKNFSTCFYTVTSRTSWGITYNKASVLKKFCDFLLKVYNDPKGDYKYAFTKAVYHYKAIIENNRSGGAADMYLIWLFGLKEIPPGRIGEMSYIFEKNKEYNAWDHNVNDLEGYVEDENLGGKLIQFKDGVPYCVTSFDKKKIKFNCIHFQGSAKRRMREIYENLSKVQEGKNK